MKAFIVVALCIASIYAASLHPVEHEKAEYILGDFGYALPSGSELIIGNIRTTFNCGDTSYGYYADMENDCRVYHVCQPLQMPDGTLTNKHFSFACGNNTVFDQQALVCKFADDAIPCKDTPKFYHVNLRIGVVEEKEEEEQNL